jgi:hypothetical protein
MAKNRNFTIGFQIDLMFYKPARIANVAIYKKNNKVCLKFLFKLAQFTFVRERDSFL